MFYLVKDPSTDDLTVWHEIDDAPGILEYVQTIYKGSGVSYSVKPLSGMGVTTTANIGRNIISVDEKLESIISSAVIYKL